ncbi:MAG: NADH-quinone oxidoreductase subunit [Frankiaceae bacterium]|jgi:NADH-quinone oxidoreductase subunit C|nr:NADH-quinone oxidoreductase subunit [Frankiaceae bacterium]MDX6225529.1 NADH-quinone oxidoreductase subunit [Frankiales bacterium]MDX6273975.1 NADH-quinone oxidoreductase subunit [Frankiales bacterium]
MTPDELGSLLTTRLGEGSAASVAYDVVTVDVPTDAWVTALETARDVAGCTYFDWLSAVDELQDGFSVVCHLWSIEQRHHVQLRTRVPRDRPVVRTATGVFKGADWHERETHEMFGVIFDGHPNLVPLLLPDGFEGRPLRKDFVLASRVARPWPGAKEPGESDDGSAPSRRKTLPPGVPDAAWREAVPEPGSWGPEPAPQADGA